MEIALLIGSFLVGSLGAFFTWYFSDEPIGKIIAMAFAIAGYAFALIAGLNKLGVFKKIKDVLPFNGPENLLRSAQRQMRHGEYSKAFKFLKNALSKPIVDGEVELKIQLELARCWVQLGYDGNAIEPYEKAVLGDCYLWQAIAYEELAVLYDDDSESLSCYLKSVQIRDNFHLPAGTDTIDLYRKIADLLWDSGEEEDARDWYRNEMKLREQFLPSDVDVTAQKALLTAKETDNDEVKKAQYILAINTLLPYLSQLHPRVAAIYYDLSGMYYIEALRYGSSFIRIDEKSYYSCYRVCEVDEDTKDRRLSLINQAVPRLKLALDSQIRVLDDEDNDNIMSAWSLYSQCVVDSVMISDDQEELLFEAEIIAKYIVQICQSSDHISLKIADAYHGIGRIFMMLKKHSSAILMFELAVPVYERFPEEKMGRMGLSNCFNSLANAYVNTQIPSYDKAVECSFQAMRIAVIENENELAEALIEILQIHYEDSDQSRSKPFEEWVMERIKKDTAQS